MVYGAYEPDKCERAGDEGRRPYAGDADVRPDERDVQCVLTLADPHWRVGRPVLVRIKGG